MMKMAKAVLGVAGGHHTNELPMNYDIAACVENVGSFSIHVCETSYQRCSVLFIHIFLFTFGEYFVCCRRRIETGMFGEPGGVMMRHSEGRTRMVVTRPEEGRRGRRENFGEATIMKRDHLLKHCCQLLF